MSSEIAELEGKIFELTKQLAALRAESPGVEVKITRLKQSVGRFLCWSFSVTGTS